MKFITNTRALLVGGAASFALPLMASPYAAVITAVDWDDVVAGVIAIAALVAAVKVVMAGSRMLLRSIRG